MANSLKQQFEYLIDRDGISDLFDIKDSVENGKEFTVRVQSPLNQQKELEEMHGVDVSAMMENVLCNETLHSLMKYLMQNIEDAEETFSFDKKFLITSGRVGACLQDDPLFIPDVVPTDENSVLPIRSGGGIYFIGSIGETKIFVNPYISWTQTHSLAFDQEKPIVFSVEKESGEDFTCIRAKCELPENLKCYVWNCPTEILDRL